MARYLLIKADYITRLTEAVANLQTVLSVLVAEQGELKLPDPHPAQSSAPPTLFDDNKPRGVQTPYKYTVTRGKGWKYVLENELPVGSEYTLSEIVDRLTPLVAHQSDKRKPRDTIRRALDVDDRFARVAGTGAYRRLR